MKEDSKPVYFMCTNSIHSTMLENVHKMGRSVQCLTSSLSELKKLSEEVELNTRFIGNNTTAYESLLYDCGIQYTIIPDRILLNPERNDVLYVLSCKTQVREDQVEFPDYATIEVLVYKVI